VLVREVRREPAEAFFAVPLPFVTAARFRASPFVAFVFAAFAVLVFAVFAREVLPRVVFTRLRLGPAALFAVPRLRAPDLFADRLFLAFDPLPFAFAMRSPLT